jgi:phosphate/sulfate permease
MVAAALISVATLLKLPLSTTYVTFIVAMAAALPDKAWGRESSVYRVSGVVTVVGGWFITAIGASILAGLIAVILFYGEIFALIGFAIIVAVILLRSRVIHRNRENDESQRELSYRIANDDSKNVLDFALIDASKLVNEVNITITKSINALVNEDLHLSRNSKSEAIDFPYKSQKISSELLNSLKYTNDDLDVSGYFANALGEIRIITGAATNLCSQNFYYVNNTHDSILEDQAEDILDLDVKLESFLNEVTKILKDRNFESTMYLNSEYEIILKKLKKLNKAQLKRVKKNKTKIRRSMLIFSLYNDVELIIEKAKTLVDAFANLYKVSDFELED